MPSRAVVLALQAALLSYHTVLAGSPPQCPSNGPISCQSTITNTCCAPSPGGQLLQVQLWDGGSDSDGPNDSWTIHGLWPDSCDGSYQENCDSSREYNNITDILQSYNQQNLLSYMQTYWVSDDESADDFWAHEWNTHGTCISTFDPSCYTDYTPQEEVVDFFNTVVNLFQTLDTYTILSNAGITPDANNAYDADDIESALAQAHGADVVLSCTDGNLYQVEYFFNYQGSVQSGNAIAVNPTGASSNCDGQIMYLPKQ